MRRREVIAGLGGAILAWPLAARGQQPALPAIGFLDGGSFGQRRTIIGAFQQGLSATGYIDGKNVTVEYRWADGQYDRLPTLAKELVDRHVAVIATGGPKTERKAAVRRLQSVPSHS